MSAPLTLYITHTARDPAIAADFVAAARWTSRYPCKTLVVVPEGRRSQYENCGADLIYESAVEGDFQFYAGLYQAIHDGVEFEQAACLRDDGVFLGKGIDERLNRLFYDESADLLGVADRYYYGESFLKLGSFFSECRVPHETWDKPPASYTAHSSFLALTSKLARDLYYRRLLVPPNYRLWPLSFGAYASWTCQLLMLSVVLKGTMERPHAPFYVNDGWGGAYNPPPYLLHSGVLVYWSLRHIAGYSEAETRSWCRSLREANP
jgi:hypothetical protein